MKRTIRPTDIHPDPHREVGDEIRFHLEMRMREFIDQGMSPDEARRAARASFGDVTRIATELGMARADRDRFVARRDWWRGTWLDLKHAARALRRRPMFSAATVLTLALGTGATIAIFTVVNGVLLRPLPYADAGRLAMLWLHGDGVRAGERWPWAAGLYLDAMSRTRSFTSTAAFRSWPQTIVDGGVSEQLQGARVTASLFPTLGVRSIAGRVFDARDTVTGAPPVALISHSLWKRKFGGAPSIVGHVLTVNGLRTVIVGILPDGFGFPRGAELPSGLQFGVRTDVWTPMGFTAQDAQNYGTQNLAVIARLRGGTTLALAQGEVEAAVDQILLGLRVPIKVGARAISLHDQAAEPVQRLLLIVLAGVVLVLVIACVNVTSLLIARTAERSRELAVRTALGARRSRMARQLLTENFLLAALGGGAGVLLAAWGVRALLALVPGSLPRADDVHVDWRVVAVAGGLTLACAFLFGVVSALSYAPARMLAALHDGNARSSSGPRARLGRRTLVTVEVALSLVLLITAGLLVSSFVKLQRVDAGFDRRDAVTADVTLPLGEQFNPRADGPAWARFFEQLMNRLSVVPGIDAVGGVSALPVSRRAESSTFTIVGRTPPVQGQRQASEYSVVAGAYFRAAGIRVRQGRVFDARDRTDAARVVVISTTLAKRYFPGENPIGTQIVCGCEFFAPGPREVIGVVDDVKLGSLTADNVAGIYIPESQAPYPFLSLVVRSRRPERDIVTALRRELQGLDAGVPLTNVRTLDDVFAESMARQRFSLTLISAFAASALLLSLLGLYGIVTLGVQQRSRELGVRMALGARPRDVRALVLREGLLMTAIGIVAGWALATGATAALGDLLFDIDPRDPTVFAVCALLVAGTALGASYLPARRATRVEPSSTLRMD
jgi:putative ABC transport system permease protein